MTTAPQHLDSILHAVRASLAGDSSIVETLFSPDVHAWLPAAAPSAVAVAVEIEDRRGAFVDVSVTTLQSRTFGGCTWVEWLASVTHAGDLLIGDTVRNPTGMRAVVHGVTIAQFDGGHIVAYHQTWDCPELDIP